MTRSHKLVCLSLLVLILLPPNASFAAPDSYAKNNHGIANIQASSAATGGATDSNGNCIFNAPYNNHRGESNKRGRGYCSNFDDHNCAAARQWEEIQ